MPFEWEHVFLISACLDCILVVLVNHLVLSSLEPTLRAEPIEPRTLASNPHVGTNDVLDIERRISDGKPSYNVQNCMESRRKIADKRP